jgi:hypothetical protein
VQFWSGVFVEYVQKTIAANFKNLGAHLGACAS